MLPWLNKGFYYTMQLTLAAVSRLAMETPQLFRSQEINQSSLFPWSRQLSQELGVECVSNLVVESRYKTSSVRLFSECWLKCFHSEESTQYLICLYIIWSWFADMKTQLSFPFFSCAAPAFPFLDAHIISFLKCFHKNSQSKVQR